MKDSAFEIDHIFVAVSGDAPELDDLESAGFEEGPGNIHQGQGTACRRLFLENVYLEFIWLENRHDASGPLIRRTGLAHRAGREDGVSRLGVALRPRRSERFDLPVRTWPYKPPYLPDGLAIPVANNSTVLSEPLLFFMPWERQWSAPHLPHPNGARTVTDISITVLERQAPSPEMKWLRAWEGIRMKTGPSERIEVPLDGGITGRSLTLGSAPPVTLRW